MKKTIIAVILIVIAIVIIALVFDWGRKDVVAPPIDNTLPIVVDFPKDNQVVISPIKITGKARGNWFFEASFPIQLVDSSGNIISTGIGQAKSDWMTTDFVDFEAEISYSSTTGRALLVLNKDNPSGNPDFDQSIFIPVILK